MKCDNCKGESVELDDVMGEEVCIDCGYVLISSMVEETQHPYEFVGESLGSSNLAHLRSADYGVLGSKIIVGDLTRAYNRPLLSQLKRTQRRFSQRDERSVADGYLECNMVLAPYLPNVDLKERTHAYYKKLLINHHFSLGDTMPLRAVGLVFFVLKEFGMPITMDELSKANNVNPNKASKVARKVARCLGKPYVLHVMSNSHWAEKVGLELNASREYISDVRCVVDKVSTLMDKHCLHFSKTYLASCFWMVSRMRCKVGKYPEFSQSVICKSIHCSDVGMRKALAIILNTLGLTVKQLSMLSVDEFLGGIRYD